MAKYIISGGPCTGKTTLIEMIMQSEPSRYSLIEESAREIITAEQQREMAHVGYKGVFPWTEPVRFQEAVARMYDDHMHYAPRSESVIMDRSSIDSIAYLNFNDEKIPNWMYRELKEVESNIVFIPDSLDQYVNDRQRKESCYEAMMLHELIIDSYKELGHKIVRVPAIDKEERLEYIMKFTK